MASTWLTAFNVRVERPPPWTQTKRVLLIGASALERGVRPFTRQHLIFCARHTLCPPG